MIYYYDLHIHSVLSPCADILMTPNNILNMAMLKQLDIIAITDHNSLKQTPILNDISKSYDMLYIPGVEVTVKEGFDVLIYLKNIEDAMSLDQFLSNFIVHQDVDLNKYNIQTICDINDETESIYPYLLSGPLMLTFEDLLHYLSSMEHLIFYAHVDRYIDKVIDFVKKYPCDGVEYKHKICFENMNYIMNSDAHQIIDILERTEHNQIDLQHLDIDCFFKVFNHG